MDTSEAKVPTGSNFVERMKEIIRMILPPVFVSLFKAIRSGRKINFSGVYKEIPHNEFDNLWIQNTWLEISERKLQLIKPKSRNDLMLEPDLNDYEIVICLMVNLLSSKRVCNVLDFGGGTGYIYFRLYPHLANHKNVVWHVLDKNTVLYEIGRKYATTSDNYQICYCDETGNGEAYSYDVIYVNSVMQYLLDYKSVLSDFLKLKPRYIVFTRLFAGYIDMYITFQITQKGHKTPCLFLNLSELEKILSASGYEIIFKSPYVDSKLDGCYAKNIPRHLQIPYSINVIFENTGRYVQEMQSS